MNHPMLLTTKFNDQQKAWDVVLMLGDYKTKEQADQEAQALRHLLMANDGAWEKSKA